jgi:hypothetical protein
MLHLRRSLAVFGISAALFAACSAADNPQEGTVYSELSQVSTGSVVATLSVNQWNTGYYATVTLKNNGSAAASG